MLGIIGGMGPSASSLFYDMVTEKTGASRDQDNIDLVLLSHASLPDRTEVILSNDKEQIASLAGQILRDALFLQSAGADAICVTCNTAHYFVDLIEDRVKIPFIHMIRESAREVIRIIDEHKGGRVAILATEGTLRTRLYQKEFDRYGVDYWVPDDNTEKKIMSEIYDYVKAGKKADPALWLEIELAMRDAGCTLALLGCTELPIVKEDLMLGDSYIDPMEIMAQRAVEFCRR